jgi:hypothetical protein
MPRSSRPRVPGAGAPDPEPTTAGPEAPVPIDRASDPDRGLLDLLANELAATGRRARSRKAQLSAALPDAGFSMALRERLLQPAEAALMSGAMADAIAEPVARPRLHSRSPGASRQRTRVWLWAVLAVGILLLAGVAAKVASGWLGAPPINRAGDVASATLVRDGSSRALVTGMDLAAGDEIKVAAGGHATLILGGSQARLAAGADLKVNVLSSLTTQFALLAGRAYNRVVLPAGGEYEVITGPYAWTATGTAFDLDRTAAPGGGEQVTLLALEHSIRVTSLVANQQIAEGTAVTVIFGGPGSDSLTVGPIPTVDFTDPWLISNAKTDEALGYPIGALAGVALAPNGTPVASPAPSTGPDATPSESPGSTSGPSPSPSTRPTSTPQPTQQPTPTATVSPSPTPTATPQPSLSLSLTSCSGGVVLSWSKYTGPGFVRYVTLRDTAPGIRNTYIASKVLPGSSTSSIGKTSADDPTVLDGRTYFYRTLVLGSGNTVLQASAVETGLGYSQAGLGPAAVGGPLIIWSPYSSASCFSEYKVLYSFNSVPTAGNAIDSILVTNRLQSNVAVPDASHFSSGDTVYFRVQVVRKTALGEFVVGETSGTAPSYTYP